MSELLNVNVVSYPLPDTATGWQGNNVIGHVIKAPAAGVGGAITILSAHLVLQNTTDAGTASAWQLENHGTGGTAIKSGAAGTVAAAIGGTADVITAATPKAFTLLYPKLSAGEWLVLRKTETNSSDPTRGVLVVEYLHGV